MFQMNSSMAFAIAVGIVLLAILLGCLLGSGNERKKASVPFILLMLAILGFVLWFAVSRPNVSFSPTSVFAKVVNTFSPTSSSQPQTASSSLDNIEHFPTISYAQIEQVLERANSPAKDYAKTIYQFGVQTGINPAVALAFFHHESGYGTQGAAVQTKSFGNIVCTPGWPRCIGRFRAYASWLDGIRDWYGLIQTEYIAKGLKTLPEIIHMYSPDGDGDNNEAAYVNEVRNDLAQWQKLGQA